MFNQERLDKPSCKIQTAGGKADFGTPVKMNELSWSKL